jgi:hypothetical protein
LLLFKRFLLSIMMFVFVAFITPSTMTLPQVTSLAVADWHHLIQLVLSFPFLHSQLFMALGIVVLSAFIIAPLLAHHRELAEVAGLIVIAAVAAALLIPRPGTHLSTPTHLRLESAGASLRLPHPPLIPLLYRKPKPTRSCTFIVKAPTVPSSLTIPSLVSHGESLKAISLMAGTWPWHITSLTNAVERYRLSPALRAYENAHNWFLPTPIGQHFWYPPRLPSASESRRLRHVSRGHVSRTRVPHACDLRPVC